MMVPVFFTAAAARPRCGSSSAGRRARSPSRSRTPPTVTVTRDGRAATRDEALVAFVGSGATLAYPVTAEVYVDRILVPDEFRAHCNRYKSPSAILGNLK